MKSSLKGRTFVLFAILFSAVLTLLISDASAGDKKKYEATFTDDGQLIRPAGWREWVFVGIGKDLVTGTRQSQIVDL